MAIKIHIHAKGRVRTIDLGPKSLREHYDELVDLLIHHISSTNDSIKQAAGVLFISPRGRVLLLKRSRKAEDHPGVWGFPAGGVEPGEDLDAAARREVYEETGFTARDPMVRVAQIESGARLFTAFAYMAREEFDPRLNHEHMGWVWADPDRLPSPVHPGVERILDMIAQPTKDDAPVGHPFYGNQYTDVVLGPKPTEAKAKGVKNQTHELLSSGHPFTIEELQKITGAKLKQQLHNAINEINKGPSGLKIGKNADGHYIVTFGGKPAPALPKELEAPVEPPKPAQEAKTEPPPANPVPEAPKPAQIPGKHTPMDAPATTSPMEGIDTKEKADAHYQDQLLYLQHQLGEMFSDPTKSNNDIAKAWKQGKANAMAQWSSNFHKKPGQAKPVEVFPEDETLVLQLASALDATDVAAATAKAMNDWKVATAKAKGLKKAPTTTPTPTPEPVKEKEPEHPANTTTPTGNHALSAPEKYVPDGHVGISASDFGPGSPFVKGLSEVHKALHASSKDAVANKKAVQARLDEKLKASPHFQNMNAQHLKNGKSSHGSLSATLISAWAGSSGDHQPISVTAQLAIRDAFGMNPDHVETAAFHIMTKSGHSEEAVQKQAAEKLGIDVSTPEKFHSFKEGMKDFALAQYHATQDHLASLGIKELHLVRGMKIGSSSAEAQHIKLKLQPASSFSTAHSTAKSFAGGHSLFVVRVPASQVLGSFCSGYGCTSESEVVVLAHPDMEAVQIGTSHASSVKAMSASIHSQVNWPAGSAPQHQEHGWPANPGDPNKIKMPTKPSTVKKFKMTSGFPVASPSAKPKHVNALTKAAAAGNVEAFNAAFDTVYELSKKYKLPATMAYASALKAEFEKQHAAHQAAAAAAAAAPKVVPAGGVKKNAHYYKKLKAAILGHKYHSEEAYKNAKAQGYTNEQILAEYNKAQHADTEKY